jgi:hypothetical protein
MKIFIIIGLIVASLAIILITAVIHDNNLNEPYIWGEIVNPGPLSSAHKFLSNKCESCHTPNKGIEASKCITCHASSPELLRKPATAFHAHLTDCRGCHAEHQGSNVRPIRMDHEMLIKSAEEYLLKESPKDSAHHSHPLSLDCNSCHAFQDKHQEFFGKQCATCHSSKTWKTPGYLHPSPTSTNCSECHKAPPSHRMMHFEMVDRSVTHEKGARVDQCYMCHQTDSFNNIKNVGWYKMH